MHINLLQTNGEQLLVPQSPSQKTSLPPVLFACSSETWVKLSDCLSFWAWQTPKCRPAILAKEWTHLDLCNPGISKYPSCCFSPGGWGRLCRDLHLQSCFSLLLFKIVVTFAFLPNFTHFLPCPSPPTHVSRSILLSVPASHLSRWHLMWSGAHPWAYSHWLIKTHMPWWTWCGRKGQNFSLRA